MNPYSNKLLLSFLFLFIGFSIQAESVNIFVDGAYNSGADSDMDKLMDKRLDNAEKEAKRIDPSIPRKRVGTKADFLAALANIKCKCGDEINLFLMGHGGKKKFIFSKAKKRKDRVLTADELKKALGKAAVECCCKINIVIFACKSGSFIEPLMEEEHVRSVYTSCMPKELSYTSAFYDDKKKFVDEGDWFKGFNEDMKDVAKGSSMAEAIAESTESAKEKMPMSFWEKQTPQGWVRDTLDVVGHAEDKVRKKNGRYYIEVIIYQPEHLRGQTKIIWLADNTYPKNIKNCVWIKGPADFDGPNDPITFAGAVTNSDKPTEVILAHVTKRYRTAVDAHILRPRWLFCDNQRIRPIKGKRIAKNVQPCKWINQPITVDDPYEIDSTDQDIVVTPASFRIQFHVESRNLSDGELTGKVLTPSWLKYTKIIVDPKERGFLKKLKGCTNLWIDMTVPTEGLPTGKNIKQVKVDDIKTWSDDVAINPIVTPTYRPMSKTIIPVVGATNIGTIPNDFEVAIKIIELPNDNAQNDVSAIPGNQKDYIKACNCTDCNVVYEDTAQFNSLQASHSDNTSFNPFIPKPGSSYRLCATVINDGDQVPSNNYSTTIFNVPTIEKPEIPSTFSFNPMGTNNTTGIVVNLEVTNNGDTPESVEVGNWIVPSTNKYQGYLIPDSYLISLAPGETKVYPLYGFCIKVTLPPVPQGASVLPFENWITPDMTGDIFTPSSPPAEDSPWVAVSMEDFGDFIPTYSGTDSLFLYKIDTDQYPLETAPTYYYNYESVSDVIDDNISTASFAPSISSNPGKLNDDLTQQVGWVGSAAIELDETEQYNFDQFDKTFKKNTEKELGVDLTTAEPNVKEAVNTLISTLYDAIDIVGTGAKVLKANPTKPKRE